VDILGKLVENMGEVFDLLLSNLLAISLSFAIFSWLTLLLPQPVFTYLHVSEIRSQYLDVLGVIAFISSYLAALWLTYRLLSLIYSYLRALFELPRLTSIECKRLYQFIREKSQTSTFFLTDGVVTRLEKKGFIYKSSSRPNSAGEQDYHIYQWIYRRLSHNPNILLSKINENDQKGIRNDERIQAT
jgi:hypothetical protein